MVFLLLLVFLLLVVFLELLLECAVDVAIFLCGCAVAAPVVVEARAVSAAAFIALDAGSMAVNYFPAIL